MGPRFRAGAGGDPRQRLGREGEARAEQLLRRAGLRILERRFRTRYGEIDLVARRGTLIVFVEVKARRGHGFGQPAETIPAAKRRRMARAALAFLVSRGWLERPCRFDVVAVTAPVGGPIRVRHIVDAFRLGDRDPG